MKYRIIAALAAAVAVAALGTAAAWGATTAAQDYLAGISCTNDTGTFVSAGGFENGHKKCGDVFTNSGSAEALCVDGTTFLYVKPHVTDPPLSDLISFLTSEFEGTTASSGACSSNGGGPAKPGVAPAPPVSYFLCYSAYQTTPGVWPKDVALQLLTQGYWLAYAVPGTVAGGTNLGGYHLVCNLASTQAVDGQFVGGDGTVLGSSYSGVQGLYPQIGG